MRTLVLGTGRSGLAVSRYLLSQGHHVIVSDQRALSEVQASSNWADFQSLAELYGHKLEWSCGGHALELLERCDEVVISPGISLHLPFLQAALHKGVRVTGEMELAYGASPKPLIAVTGTNGKSTTCSLLGDMLGSSGIVGGNIGIPLLDQVQELKPEIDWVVAEVSSFQLETVHTYRPKIAILTNITPDHLDHHKDISEYETAKSRLFSQMGSDGTAIFCQDDEAAMRIEGQVRSRSLSSWVKGFPGPQKAEVPCILTYSTRESVLNGVALTTDEEGRPWLTRFEHGQGEKLFLWEAPGLPGKAMMSNGLAAVTAALVAQLPIEKIQDALRRFQPLHYRMELAGEVDGITFINDSKATNIDSALASVHSVEGALAVIVGGKDKGVDYSTLAQGLSRRNCRVFLIGEAAGPIEAAFCNLGFGNYEHSQTIQSAIPAAAEHLAPAGGTVLLAPACSSFDQFQSAEHRGEIFNELVMELKMTRSSKA